MAVQKAFDTLTDITKRRAYDSSLEFDDSIPGVYVQSQPAETKTVVHRACSVHHRCLGVYDGSSRRASG